MTAMTQDPNSERSALTPAQLDEAHGGATGGAGAGLGGVGALMSVSGTNMLLPAVQKVRDA